MQTETDIKGQRGEGILNCIISIVKYTIDNIEMHSLTTHTVCMIGGISIGGARG